MRLLALPEKVQELVRSGKLAMGHARALLAIEDPAELTTLALEAVRRGWSVRAVEAEIRRRERSEPDEGGASEEGERRRLIVADLESRIERSLGVKVKLRTGRRGKGPGRIEFPWKDLEELDRLLKTLLKER